ncbi:MAG: ATP-binding protein [Succinivibrio sp.]|nr:ATP-binding protein [Succinivibrio sp.]
MQVPSDHIVEMAFDLYENIDYRDPKIFFPYVKGKLKDEGMHYVLLDEVQLLGDFEAVLNSLSRLPNVDLYVTGSNAKFLSKDVITEFRGRGDEIRLYPLTFGEFMSVYEGTVEQAWKEYLLYGGLPLVLELGSEQQKTQFLKTLLTETYLKDIAGRNQVRHQNELTELLNILASAIGSLTNPSKLSATFKSVKQQAISQSTIKKYIEYFEDSFLIDSALRYDVKGKRYINTPLKYYFSDLGLRNAQLNFRQVEETHALENIIFNELKVRGFNVDVGVVITNEVNKQGTKTRRQREIDFVCNQGSKRYYIQSALSLTDEDKKMQEQRSLLLTQDGFKKIIITKDAPAPLYNESGVLIMGVYDFLLDEHSLEI